jgi:hypothetical protein
MNAINEIINWDDYFRKSPAPDAATAQRWTEDTYAHVTERYRISSLDGTRLGVVREALREWNDDRVVSYYLSEYFGGPDYLIAWFKALRAVLINESVIPLPRLFSTDGRSTASYPSTQLIAESVDEDLREDLVGLYRVAMEQSRGLVENVGWCESFGALLPQAITDAALSRAVAETGAAMSAIFYLEQIRRRIDEIDSYHTGGPGLRFDTKHPDFEKTDAFFRFALKFSERS